MNEHIKLFETHSDYEEYINSQDKILPNVSFCKDQEEVHYNEKPHDYSQDYLTLEGVTAGDLILIAIDQSAIKTIYYSIDEGNTWNSCTSKVGQPTTMTTLNVGDKVLLKGYNSRYTSERVYLYNTMLIFQGTAKVYGNIMSLIYGDNFIGKNSFSNDYVFSNFFSGGIVSVENLILPATSLTEGCYLGLFQNSNITTAPKLPATTLADRCYEQMFYNCKSLTTAPKLPATTLKPRCYENMFTGCTSLTNAPELPATTLTGGCYFRMFEGCTSLNYIKCLATDISASACTTDWVDGVASTGTFVRNSAAQWYVIGTNGIPEGWEVVPPETRIIATFNVTDISKAIPIMYYESTPQFSEIEIDGVVQSSVISSYTFDTLGKHTVKYTLVDETSLGKSSFNACYTLESFIIPNNVTTIGNYSFFKCRNLTSITISKNVTSIGSNAFSGCSGITSFVIPNGVTSIPSNAFNECTSLASVTIPDNVTSIGFSAFNGCSSLTSINIPDGVTIIDSYAFRKCNSLTNIILPSSVTSIGGSAFGYCTGITSFVIGKNVTSIETNVFEGFTNLNSIVVDEENTVYDSRNNCNAIIETATNKLIQGCNNSTIPNTVIIIDQQAFVESNIQSIIIPSNVTSIGLSAFYKCKNLSSVIIESGLTTLGPQAFLGCVGLTSIIIPNSVTTIDDGAFSQCSGLTSVTIGNGVTSINNQAFDSCTNLTSITCNAMTAPTIDDWSTFYGIGDNGTLYVPQGSSGYDVWMSSHSFNDWTKVEQ